jgi:flagellar hook-length control protein FliK
MDIFLPNSGPAITPGTTVANATAHTLETSGKEFGPALDNAIANLNQKAQPAASNAKAGETTAINEMKAENLSTDLSKNNLVSAENILSAEIIGSLNTFRENVSPQTQGSSKAIISTNENEPTIFLSDVTAIVDDDNTATKVPAKAETILLQQIQQILDEGKDKGTIVIKASTQGATPQKENMTHLNALSSPVLADASENATIQAKQNITQVIMPEEQSKTVSGTTNARSDSTRSPVLADASEHATIQAKQNITQVIMPEEQSKTVSGTTNVRAESTRQDVTEQFLNAKLSGAEKEKNDTSQQHHDQILNVGKDKGTIAIKASTQGATPQKENVTHLTALSSPVLADAPENTTIQAKQNIAQVIMPEEHSKTVSGATNARSESTRQDVTEQFINAKLSGAEKEKNDTSQQHHDQKGSEGQNKNTFQQTIATNSSTIRTESGLGETTFSQQLGSSFGVITAPTTTSPLSIEGKFAPGAHLPVAEQEIVDTLIQRFNVNPRLQTSKLTMQLHPAELGSLKIDITVKNGSISAHIITQSHQVLETLDKNISRLREVLQDQGYQVEDFKITLNTDRGNEQQLFQEQFESKQQDFTASKRTIHSETETFNTLLQGQEGFNPLTNKSYSVNLTA